MAEISRSEGRSAYRKLIEDAVPVQYRTRVTQLLESVVFGAEPILRQLEHFEVRYGTAAPTSSDYPEDGFGLFIDETADAVYVCLQWRGEFYILGGTGSASGEANTASSAGTGTSLYYQKTGVDLEFNAIKSENAYLQVALDGVTHDIELTIDESAFDATYVRRDGTSELTGEWGLGGTYGISEIDHLDFDLTFGGSHQERRLHWDDDAGTLSLGMPGGNVELQIGQEHQIRCRNTTGVTITNGAAVYQVGNVGNKPLIALAQSDNILTSFSFGVATEDIANNSNGYVTKIGIVNEIDTSLWAAGTPLYLSDSVAGALTPTVPTAPSISVFMGVVIDSQANGSISVNPTVVPRLQSLSDVLAGAPSDEDFPVWVAANSRFEYDNIGDYLPRAEWLENGFDDASDTSLVWDDSTRTLTLSPAVTSFDYHYAGYEYNETGNVAATITDTEGLWVFYIGSGGAASLSTVHNPSYEQVEDLILNEVIVAYVYWDATNNDGRLLDERHGSVMGRGTHHYLHEVFGSQYISGMTPGDITTDQSGAADSDAQFSITAGRFYDEDIEHDTLAHASTDTWEAYYVDGSGYVRWVDCEATFPVYAIGGVIAYNNAGTLTAVTSNKYCCYHIFATNINTDSGGDYYPVVTPGIAVYNSKADAQDAALTEIQSIDFGDWPKEEIIPVATVIYHHGAAMSNGVEAAIQSTEGGGDFIDWRYTAVSGSSTSVNDHGALSGLADDDHQQYLLIDGSRAMTGGLTVPSGTVGSPGLAFGDGDTGFYELADDNLGISLAGVLGAYFGGAGALYFSLGAAILNETPSATNPVLVPNSSDLDTGIGTSSGDELSLIAGGTEVARVDQGNARVYLPGEAGGAYFQGGWRSLDNIFAAGDSMDVTQAFDLAWSNDAYYWGTKDLGLTRDSAGVLRVTDGSTGRGDLLADAAHFDGNVIVDWGSALQVDVGLGETPTDAVQGNGFGIVFGDAAALFQIEGSDVLSTADIEVSKANAQLLLTGSTGTMRLDGDTLQLETTAGVGGTGKFQVHGANGLTYQDNTATDYDVWTEKNFDPTDYLPLTGGTLGGDLTLAHGYYLQGTTSPTPLAVNLIGLDASNNVEVGHAGAVTELLGSDIYAFENFYIDKTSSPGLYLREAGATNDYTRIQDAGTTSTWLKQALTGGAVCSIRPQVTDGTSLATVDVFRTTNTSGSKYFIGYIGDGTSTQAFNFNVGNGVIQLCKQGGTVTLEEGNLRLYKTSNPTITLAEGGSTTSKLFIEDTTAGNAEITKLVNSGSGVMDFNVLLTDGVSTANIRMFRETNTTGPVSFQVLEGDGANNPQHILYGNSGDASFCINGGKVICGGEAVQLPYLGAAPSGLANGMIWMESDGLHIYYGGAEKVVAGV